ncbi:MAG: hypothetical protein ACYCOU_03675 [Sulfobacillus sp.]
MKKIRLMLEFGVSQGKKPRVSFLGVDDYGVPMTSHNDEEQDAIFSKFSKACYEFCEELIEAGELK